MICFGESIKMNNKYDANKAIEKLEERGIRQYICPYCQGRDFSILEKMATIGVSTEVKSVELGHYIPAAIMLCNKCGNLSFFALANLGMLDGGESGNAQK